MKTVYTAYCPSGVRFSCDPESLDSKDFRHCANEDVEDVKSRVVWQSDDSGFAPRPSCRSPEVGDLGNFLDEIPEGGYIASDFFHEGEGFFEDYESAFAWLLGLT